jgi:hypothetical protein
MPPGSLPRRRPTRRTVPWLLATLTMALALAGPAYADSLGAAELQEAEAMLAAEIPDEPIEAPPELPEPVAEPAEASPSEPAPAPVEVPVEEPAAAPPAEEAVTLGATDQADPVETDPVEEVATEPPAYISDEPSPAMPNEDEPEAVDEEDADTGIPPVVVPVNLNVDIRILSPGDDGDVSQVIDLGDLPGLGSGNPSDVLGGLGPGDLGLDWTWNWNWTWDCGDSSVAGLDWNWTWTWSGDCAAGILDEPRHAPGSLDDLRFDRHPGLLGTLPRDALGVLTEIGDEPGPLVSTPGSGGTGHDHPRARADSETAPATALPPSDGGPWLPSDALTSFASTGATPQSTTATPPARRPAGADPNGDPERLPAGPPAQAMGLAPVAGGGGGGGGAFTVLLLAALVGALALVPPPAGGRIAAVGQKLSSLLSSSRLERPG